ncbi:MAG: hypothetical protein R3C32_02370 [Chloroflexota bacterium]
MTLDDAGLTLGATPAADLVADVRAAHAWSRVERDGAWVGLDPSLPASEPGQRLVRPAARQALPDDAWQTVTFRVVASHMRGCRADRRHGPNDA